MASALLVELMVRVKTAYRVGPIGCIAEVEAVKIRALPTLTITGLAGDVVRESRERVLGCLSNLGFDDVPSGRVIVHLVPASDKKQGSQFDLAILLAVLAVESKIPREVLERWAAIGELTLDGRVRAVAGLLALATPLVASSDIETVIVPKQNQTITALLQSEKLRVVGSVAELIAFARGSIELPVLGELNINKSIRATDPFSEVLGQRLAKRALSVAVAGRHHTLLVGSPGVGKSILAHASSELHPRLTRPEMVESLGICEVAGMNDSPPFRTPHHSISAGAFLGGGSGELVPGEVTLAHRGILFLDEFPEFRRDAIEGLREPLETGRIHLHRVGRRFEWPARFTLIAAMNPCPCGYRLDANRRCTCSGDRYQAYSRRISGPILDRMDMVVVLDSANQSSAPPGSTHKTADIDAAVERQLHRYRNHPGLTRNADVRWGSQWNLLDVPAEGESWVRTLAQSPINIRTIHKVLRISRTLADVDGAQDVGRDHVMEAWQLRCQFSATDSIRP